ncbi:MAG TPA: hypothetical protein VK166_02550 [Chitinophagaceae bacterium]|nr:hypothetical protein [Chitinophagaceae bacterium]
MSKQQKALIIFWEGYLDVAPTLVEWIRYLVSKNILVKLFVADSGENRQKVIETFDPSTVQIRRVNTVGRPQETYYKLFFNKLTWRLFPQLLRNMEDELVSTAIDRFARVIGEDQELYDTVYCVDATGLYAFKKSGVKAKKLVNISLEILDTAYGKPTKYLKKIKQVERDLMIKQVDHVVIQDEHRRQFLERTLGYSLAHYSYLPNSVKKDDRTCAKGKYFHELFGFENDQKILLSAGMISESVCSLDVSRALGSWTTKLPVKVVFHERIEITENAAYYERVKAMGKGKVFLSLKPLPYQELYKIFSSADIGLAIYSKNHGDNFGIIGSASGKLFQYIKFGMPVIASDLPGLKEIVEAYRLGVVVDSPEQIPSAVELIMGNYEQFSNNARTAFEENLNMDLFLETVYEGIYN